MPCLDAPGLLQFYQLVYTFLAISWMYILSVVMYALYEDGYLQPPNVTADPSGTGGNETMATTLSPWATTLSPNATNSSGFEGVYNPFPWIPVQVLGVVVIAVVTSVVQRHSPIRNMNVGQKILYASFVAATLLLEVFFFLGAFMPNTSFLLKTIPVIIILGAAFLTALVVGGLFCSDRDAGRGALLVCTAAVIGGLLIPQVVFIAMKLDSSIDWRWDVALIPCWILDIALVLVGAIFAELHRRKLHNGGIVEGDGYFVALQFLAWIVVGPLIVFQILLCVRENQLHPIIPDSGNASTNDTTAAPFALTTTMLATTVGPAAGGSAALSGLQLISPILAGWCCILLVPLAQAFVLINARIKECCERLRGFEKRFHDHMLERDHRTVAEGGGSSDGQTDAGSIEVAADSGDLPSNDSPAQASLPLTPVDTALHERWLLASARLLYADSEEEVIRAFEGLQQLALENSGAVCTPQNRALVLAVARKLREASAPQAAAGARPASAVSSARFSTDDETSSGASDDTSDSVVQFGASSFLQMLAGGDGDWQALMGANPYLLRALSNMSSAASSSASGSGGGSSKRTSLERTERLPAVWSPAAAGALQALLLLMVPFSQNVRTLALDSARDDADGYLGTRVTNPDVSESDATV